MKKIIISTIALATVSLAGANEKALVAASLPDKAEVKLELRNAKAVKNNEVAKIAVNRMLKENAKMNLAAEAENAVNPLYYYPNGTFFSFFNFEAAGEEYFYPNVAFAPAFADNVWANSTWFLNETGRPSLVKPENASFNWQILGNNDAIVAESDEYDFVDYREASLQKGQGYYSPVLTANDATYQYGQQGSTEFFPQFFEYGGNGDGDPEFMQMLSSEFSQQLGGAAVENLRLGGARPYNTSADDFLTNFTGGAFSYKAAYPADDVELEFYYADEEGGLPQSAIKVIGMCQDFPAPAAPYALSTITVTARVTCDANAKLAFTFCKVEADGIDLENPIHQYTYVFPEPLNDAIVDIEVPVTSSDNIGDELGYATIDSEMMMIITGFTDTAIKAFNPYIAGYVYDRSLATRSNAPIDAYAMIQVGTGDDAKIGFTQTNYIAGFGNDMYATYNSMVMSMNVEYPYVKPFMNLETEEEYDMTADKTMIGLTLEKPDVLMAVLCPGDVENVTIATEEGDELPAWLAYEAASAAEVDGVEAGQKYFYLYFALEGENPQGTCNVVVEYKGQSHTFIVTTDAAGIDNVVAAEKAELDWNAPVYNVMGQKVSQGFKGIAIQNGNKFVVK